MQNLKTCQIVGHRMNQVTLVCTFKSCKCPSRWVCEECQQIHAHQNRSSPYLITLEQFSNKLNNLTLPNIQVLNGLLDTVMKLKKEIILTFDKISNLIEFTNIHQQYIESNEDISLLSRNQLDSLIKFKKNQRSYNQIQNNIQSMMIQLQNLKQEKTVQYDMIHYQDNAIKNMQYPNISQNEKYLGFGNDREKLCIRSLQTNRRLHKITTMQRLCFVKFSNNSKFILIADNKNNINYFSIKRNLKLLFRINTKKLNQMNQFYHGYIHIIWVDGNSMLINAQDIILFDILKKKNLLVIKKEQIDDVSIEYDRVNNFIITSHGKMISFYEKHTGNQTINQNTYKKNINSIQSINEGYNLMTAHINSLRLWRIDHYYKRLTNIKYFDLEMFYAQAVYLVYFERDHFFVRNKNNLIIFNNNFEIQYELHIKGSDFEIHRRFQQYMSQNYIITQDENDQSIILKNNQII